MKNPKRPLLPLFAILLTANFTSSCSTHAHDAHSLITAEFAEIARSTAALDPRQTLYVVDIDNTILRTQNDLASEHWFLWQKSLLDAGQTQLPAVTNSIPALLQLQGWMFRVGRTRPVSSEFLDYLAQVRRRGGRVIALTSRSIDMRDATLKDIRLNGIQFATPEELGLRAFADPAPAYDLKWPGRSGLSAQDVTDFKLGPASDVEFAGGVFLTQGQPKGILLKVLLHQSDTRFRNLVFIDDRAHHVENIRAVFRDRPERLYAYQFVRSREWVESFERSDKREAQAAWCAFARGVTDAALADPSVPFNPCPPGLFR